MNENIFIIKVHGIIISALRSSGVLCYVLLVVVTMGHE